jgi:hypothetical protein
MDYEQMAAELIRALRGRRSQLAFSRRLGFRTNVVHTWEAQRRWPTASRSLAVAQRAGVDPKAALTRFYRTVPPWLPALAPASREFVTRFLEDLRGRWLKGEAEPRLPDFLRLIEAMSLRVLDFVAALVDPNELPSLSARWQKLEAGRRAAFDLPWSHAVLRVIELESYQRTPHRPGYIAEQLGIGQEEEKRCVDALLGSGQLDWDGERYRVGAVLTDTIQKRADGSRSGGPGSRSNASNERATGSSRTTCLRSPSATTRACASYTSHTSASFVASSPPRNPPSAWCWRTSPCCRSPGRSPTARH